MRVEVIHVMMVCVCREPSLVAQCQPTPVRDLVVIQQIGAFSQMEVMQMVLVKLYVAKMANAAQKRSPFVNLFLVKQIAVLEIKEERVMWM